MAVILSAAANLDWVMALCGFKDIPETFGAAEKRGYHKNSPIFLPYLSGERTPHNDPTARGVFFGLTPETNKADLAHAVMEGVALAFCRRSGRFDRSGQPDRRYQRHRRWGAHSLLGTPAGSALNKPMTYREGGEVGAAYGAARLGRLALTGEDPDTVCVMPPVTRVVEPEAEMSELLAHRRLIYVSLYQNLKKTFREYAI